LTGDTNTNYYEVRFDAPRFIHVVTVIGEMSTNYFNDSIDWKLTVG